MRKLYPDTRIIMLTEEEASCATREHFGNFDWGALYIIDVMLMFPYFNGALEPINTDRGNWQNYCVSQYAQSPYTLLSAYHLWRKAYYLETSVLLRHLLEVFVQMRYFEKHPELLLKHVASQSRKDRVQFKTMFDELSPDSYKHIYGEFLSTYAHGNANMIFRAKLTPPSATERASYQPFIGCKFDEVFAVLLHSFFTSIALGFVNYHSIFFPKNTVASDVKFSRDLLEAQQWLTSSFDKAKNQTRTPLTFKAIERLIAV